MQVGTGDQFLEQVRWNDTRERDTVTHVKPPERFVAHLGKRRSRRKADTFFNPRRSWPLSAELSAFHTIRPITASGGRHEQRGPVPPAVYPAGGKPFLWRPARRTAIRHAAGPRAIRQHQTPEDER